MKLVTLHHEAEAEIVAATQFYEMTAQGVSERFLDEIERALRVIATSPQSWPFFSRSVRRYLLRRFPFGLLYQVYEDHVYVIAVMHLSRDPNYWKHRLGS